MLAFFAVTHTCIRVPICNLFDFSGETQTAASLDTSVSCLEPIWKVTLMGLTTTTAVPLSSRSGALRSAPRSPPAIFPFQRQLAKTWNPKANESEAIRIDSKETKTEKSALPRTSFFKNLSPKSHCWSSWQFGPRAPHGMENATEEHQGALCGSCPFHVPCVRSFDTRAYQAFEVARRLHPSTKRAEGSQLRPSRRALWSPSDRAQKKAQFITHSASFVEVPKLTQRLVQTTCPGASLSFPKTNSNSE